MKQLLTLFWILFALLPSSFAGQTTSLKTATLDVVVDELAETYGIAIIYDVEDLKAQIVYDWKMRGDSFESDLEALLRPRNFEYKKLNTTTYIIKKTKLEQRQELVKTPSKIPSLRVSGNIIDDETNEPLIGVNITVKDKQQGAVSDYTGNFEIDVEEGQTLVFQYIGYEVLELKVQSAALGTIRMYSDVQQLKEVVVVGYGTQKRSDLTGALSSISQEELKALPSSSLDQALQGRAAGVYVTQNSGAPGGGVSVRIRGIASTLSAEPLYVIDGIPVVNDNQGTSANFSELDGGGQNTNALNTINPNDIESIEILKDASATAIYGARAANGVVLITTKRGQKGQSSITFDTYYGLQEIAKKIPVMNLREYADYYNDINFEPLEEFEDLELLGEGTDWQDAVFRQAAMQNYQLTLSGGSEKTRFALSTGYHFKEGIVVGSDFTRLSAKVNIDHSFNNKIRLGNSILISRTSENITFNDNSNGVVFTALLMVPNAPVSNADGTFAGPQAEITLPFDNPVARALETSDVNKKMRILANVYAEVDLLPWLKYRTEFGTDVVYSNHNTFYPSFERGNFFGQSSVNRSLNNNLFWINKHLLTANKTFAKQHNITALLGYEMQEGKFEWLYASRNNLPTNDLRELNLGDAGQQQNGGGGGEWALLSYFGRFNYGFSDRYLLTATVRIDGSSRFGKNNRYGTFPSAAFAWRASNEAFLKNIDALDNLKFRVGWGAVGNQEIGIYSYSSNLRAYSAVLGDQLITGFAPDNIANPDVRWESSYQTNIGMDLGLFKNRLEIIADFYIKKSDGMLLPALLPSSAGGLNPPFVNIGEIENRGIELSLNTVNMQGAFEWRSSLNFSVNTNEVISLGSNGNLIGIIQRIPVTRTEEGKPISQFYGYVTEGIFQSQAEVEESPFQQAGTRAGDIRFSDLNGDGIINDSDQTFLGNPFPDFTLNFTNNVAFKGFDFSFFLQGVYGNEILNLIRRDTEGMAGLGNQTTAVIGRYTAANPSETMPRASGSDPNANRRISDRFIEDGSFLRLKNMTFGYNVPKATLRKVKIRQLRAYISSQNLYTWTNYSGYDPEVGSYNQNPLINGVENGRYPLSRSVTVGLNIGF